MYVSVDIDIDDVLCEIDKEELTKEMRRRGVITENPINNDVWYRLNTNGENLFELLEQQFCHEVGYTPERLKQIIASGTV